MIIAIIGPCHEKMDLSVVRFEIIQTRMLSLCKRSEVGLFVWIFLHIPILCERTVKEGSGETGWMRRLARPFPGHLISMWYVPSSHELAQFKESQSLGVLQQVWFQGSLGKIYIVTYVKWTTLRENLSSRFATSRPDKTQTGLPSYRG